MIVRKAILATAVGATMSLFACGVPLGPDGAGQQSAGQPTSARPPLPEDVVGQIEQAALAYPDHYSGLAVSEGSVTVYRRPNPALDQAVRGAAPDASVIFRDAPHSRRALDALTQRVLADREFWQAQGVAIWTVGPRHDGSGVEVGTPNPDTLRARAPARYGNEPIMVVPMTSAPVPAHDAT